MRKIVRLTENDLTNLVKRIMNEQEILADKLEDVPINTLGKRMQNFLKKYKLDVKGSVTKNINTGEYFYYPDSKYSSSKSISLGRKLPDENELHIFEEYEQIQSNLKSYNAQLKDWENDFADLKEKIYDVIESVK